VTKTDDAVARPVVRHAALILALGLAGLGLGGCETSSLLGGAGAAPQAAAVAQPTKAKVAFAPIIGAPANVSNLLTANLVSAVERQSVPVARAPGEATDYTIRGYVVAAAEKAGTKISYIWDVTDKEGKRAHRITGEEFAPGKPGKDPWASVDQAMLERIAGNTSAQLAAFVPNAGGQTFAAGGQPAATGQAVASATQTAATQTAASGATVPAAQNVALTTPQPSQGSLTSGQILQPASQKIGNDVAGGPVAALVPVVQGAPGDGQTALSKALQKQLASSGVALANAPGPSAYTVKGNVVMGQPANGKQAIKIEWHVLDPVGKKVGTVSQNNTVPQGSLDGTWGKTADAAAAAAAQGIMKLLPASTKVN
jgi:hypothetical protein